MNGYELIAILQKNPEDTIYFATIDTNSRNFQKFEIPPKRVRQAESVEQIGNYNSIIIISG